MTWTSNDTHVNSQALFDAATFSFREIVKSLSVRTISEDDDKVHFRIFPKKVKANGTNEIDSPFVEQRHRKYGRCYTFYPENDLQKLGIYYIDIELYVLAVLF